MISLDIRNGALNLYSDNLSSARSHHDEEKEYYYIMAMTRLLVHMLKHNYYAHVNRFNMRWYFRYGC